MHFFAFFVLIFLSIWNSSESCSPTQTVLENTEKIATEIKDFSEKTNLILGRILHILEEIDEIAEITEKEKSKPEESNSKQEKLNDSKQEKDSSGPSRFKRGLGLEDLPGQAKSLMKSIGFDSEDVGGLSRVLKEQKDLFLDELNEEKPRSLVFSLGQGGLAFARAYFQGQSSSSKVQKDPETEKTLFQSMFDYAKEKFWSFLRGNK